MRQDRNFLHITAADFIVRAAYQMGKTPLLPLFAVALGASDVLLGMIVSISTLTGMVTKPLFGFLSDRQGRRWWLLLGTCFFAFIPFLYGFIETPAHLVMVRIIHGTATAIYGPVTLAFVAEQSTFGKGSRLGIFGMARSGGYIVGPAVAGWLLLTMEPAAVFTMIGLISSLAFIPVLLLSETKTPESGTPSEASAQSQEPPHEAIRGPVKAKRFWRQLWDHRSWRAQVWGDQFWGHPFWKHQSWKQGTRRFIHALTVGAKTPGVWLSGGLEASTYVGTYAIKAFLPIYAATAGFTTFEIGLFFSVQEAVHLLLKPAGGYAGDRLGYLAATGIGIFLIAGTMPLLTVAGSVPALLILSAVMGAAQALIIPSTTALVAEQIPSDNLGAGLGLVGTLDNGGKVLGPVIGGLLVAGLGYGGMLWVFGGFLLVCALGVMAVVVRRRLRNLDEQGILSDGAD